MKLSRLTRYAFALLALASPGFAGTNSWTGGGPQGGLIYDLVDDPTTPDRYFAGTVNGPYRSDDDGLTWTRFADGANHTINDIAVANDGVIYAVDFGVVGDGGALLESSDGGVSWTELSLPAGQIESVAVAPSDSTRLALSYGIVGTPDGEIYLSTDGGATFTLSQTGLPLRKSQIAFHPLDPQVAYCATFEGVYRSTDGGVQWQPHNLGGEFRVQSITVSRTDPSVLLAGYVSWILLSTDGGATWTQNSAVIADRSVRISRSSADSLAAVDSSGLFLSTDGGSTWSASIEPFGTDDVRSFAFGRSNPQQMLVGASSLGVRRSPDGGQSWTDSSSGLSAYRWTKSVRSTDTVGYDWSGVFRSVDAGASWTSILDGLPDTADACSVDPADADHAACINVDGWLYETTDGGANWQDHSPAPFLLNLFSELAIDPQNPQRWGLGNNGVQVADDLMDATLAFSLDGGVSWQTTLVADPQEWSLYWANSIRFSSTDPDVIWVSGGGIRLSGDFVCWVQRSVDDGLSWQDYTELGATCFSELRVDPLDSQTVYLRVANGDWLLYRSTDAGQSWAPFVPPVGEPFSLAINPINGELYVGSDALYRSQDGGATWSPFPTTGLSDEIRFVANIDVSATDPPTLWIGTNAGTFTYTGFPDVFADGFESGDTSAWSQVVP